MVKPGTRETCSRKARVKLLLPSNGVSVCMYEKQSRMLATAARSLWERSGLGALLTVFMSPFKLLEGQRYPPHQASQHSLFREDTAVRASQDSCREGLIRRVFASQLGAHTIHNCQVRNSEVRAPHI